VRPALADERLIMIRGQLQHSFSILRQYGRGHGQRVHGAPPLRGLFSAKARVRRAIRLDFDLGGARHAESVSPTLGEGAFRIFRNVLEAL